MQNEIRETGMGPRRLVRGVVAVTCLAFAGCDVLPTPHDIETLSIQASAYVVEEGSSTRLALLATNHAGEEITLDDIRWRTSDATVAVVRGLDLHGIAPGVVGVTAEVDGLSVTRTFRVSFRDLERGSMGMRISGAGGVRHLTGSRGTYHESITGAAGSRRIELYSYPESPSFPVLPGGSYGLFAEGFPADTVLWLALDRVPEVGTHRFTALLPQIQPDGTAVPYFGNHAVLRVRDTGTPGVHTAFMPVQHIDVTVDSIDPPRPGSIDGGGTIRGSVSFEAAGIVLQEQESGNPIIIGQASNTTTMVYSEFEAPLDSWLGGVADYEIDGLPDGPISVEVESSPASSRGSQVVSIHSGSIWETGQPVLNVSALLRVNVASPDVVEAPSRDYFEGTAIDIDLILGQSGTLIELGTLVGTFGRVTVDAYDPPTARQFGMIRGSIQATAEMRGGENDGASAEVVGTFQLPLIPDCANRSPC